MGIDFTARALQDDLKAQGLPWEKAKAFDGSALVGNWVEKQTFSDLKTMPFNLSKNGEIVQEANTNQMLWDIDQLIAYCSTFFTLKIRDRLFTGTPKGVGKVQRNDVFVGTLEGIENFSIRIK